jgi:hypothetical protein
MSMPRCARRDDIMVIVNKCHRIGRAHLERIACVAQTFELISERRCPTHLMN